ncbi:MAG: sigma-70 family RNA polymerase sigma factor [Candidatus Thiodiazotropha sp.]|nr:sigma-70 family RNA polymerase sigma factor [Candidatus Thiodiazotropha sp. (ex Lucina pensylvanica)]MBT3062434.1 sigma-70 family RNA polymerase sigma factor [Candidatus Thiodiazotropha sp. (ex Lucina pensylvanica)]MBV2094301.1 sigma-70 family RNA polymerase sigma factor [Candidatus Thiodiazotropha sp. (ex Codakia orbicularis)]PUB73573.1 MAG: RNA polymerase subunit sigma-70 [gamma proteobacterium symbiont of Ctena orbiculata]PUB73963.1 MAG: RNA polymerase subunit sigma-70 [gamma proteobacter
MSENENEVTQLLAAVREGDQGAQDRLLSRVYDELRRLAASHMRRERSDHTLQATALVNEAYLRLAGAESKARDRVHFFALAAQTMRRILVDHARAKKRGKRGGGLQQTTLDGSVYVGDDNQDAVIELDDALQRLAEFDERGARAVELMFFGGLTYDEAGEVLGISKTTLFEEIKLAKAWLAKEMGG